MTAPRALPEAVVDRVRRKLFEAGWGADAPADYSPSPLADALTHAAIAEFLAIIEERAGPDWRIFVPSRTDTVPWQPWKTPTLAELLEDRDAG